MPEPDERDVALSDPLRSEKVRIACAGGVFLVALALYSATLAPTVTLVDSGELILAARSLGVAHPPGFPLYVLLSHLATLVPIGNIAVRVNFFSAVCAALASGMLTLVVFEAMLGSEAIARSRANAKPLEKKRTGLKGTTSPEGGMAGGLFRLCPAVVAGLLAAFSRTLWAYGTIAEVYTLNAFLSLTIFFLMLRWRRQIVEARERKKSQPPAPNDRLLYGAALLFGLALGVHHVTIGLCLIGYAALVIGTEGFSFFISKRLLWAALFAFGGLTIYAYLPLAASREPVLNWGDPRTLQRLYWHVTGKQYAVFFGSSIEVVAAQWGGFVRMAMREFGPPWMPIWIAAAMVGFGSLFKRDKPLFFFLLLVVLADIAYSLNYEIAEDKDAYYLPAFMSITIAAAFGFISLFTNRKALLFFLLVFVSAGVVYSLNYAAEEVMGFFYLSALVVIAISGAYAVQYLTKPIQSRWKALLAQAMTGTLLVAAPVTALASNLRYDNRSQYFVAHDYADNILNSIEPNGLLLTLDWQVYSPILYVREVERCRRDVVSIDVSLLRRSWYYAYLKREYPDLMTAASDKVEAFLEDLLHWDQDPAVYQRDQVLNQRISSRFIEMINTLVDAHIKTAPVYCAQEIPTGNDSTEGQLAKTLSAKYQFVPNGLVFRAYADRSFHEPEAAELNTRGLAGGALKFEDDDTVKVKVLPVYLSMFVNRARYLAAFNRDLEAIKACEAALQLDPTHKAARQTIAEIESARRKAGAQ